MAGMPPRPLSLLDLLFGGLCLAGGAALLGLVLHVLLQSPSWGPLLVIVLWWTVWLGMQGVKSGKQVLHDVLHWLHWRRRHPQEAAELEAKAEEMAPAAEETPAA